MRDQLSTMLKMRLAVMLLSQCAHRRERELQGREDPASCFI